MSRICLVNPDNVCPAKNKHDTCVCVPPGFSAEEWRAMEPHERKAMYEGASEVLAAAMLHVLGKGAVR